MGLASRFFIVFRAGNLVDVPFDTVTRQYRPSRENFQSKCCMWYRDRLYGARLGYVGIVWEIPPERLLSSSISRFRPLTHAD